MKYAITFFCLLVMPVAAQEYKIAVVSMIHAHVWLHLGTMLKGDKVKLVGVAETLPDLIARAPDRYHPAVLEHPTWCAGRTNL